MPVPSAVPFWLAQVDVDVDQAGVHFLGDLAAAASALVFCGVVVGNWKDGELPLPTPPEGKVGKVNLGAAETYWRRLHDVVSEDEAIAPIASTSTSTLNALASRHFVRLTVTVLTGVSRTRDLFVRWICWGWNCGLSSSQSIGTSFIARINSNFSIRVEGEQVLVEPKEVTKSSHVKRIGPRDPARREWSHREEWVEMNRRSIFERDD